MRVAVVTDDMQTVSAHFGKALHYLVYDIEGDAVKGKSVRDKVGHGPAMTEHRHAVGGGPGMANMHNAMLSNVSDCDVVISGGMGKPMYEAIESAGMRIFVTRMRNADDAVRAFVEGSLDNHIELLH